MQNINPKTEQRFLPALKDGASALENRREEEMINKICPKCGKPIVNAGDVGAARSARPAAIRAVSLSWDTRLPAGFTGCVLLNGGPGVHAWETCWPYVIGSMYNPTLGALLWMGIFPNSSASQDTPTQITQTWGNATSALKALGYQPVDAVTFAKTMLTSREFMDKAAQATGMGTILG